MRESAGNADAQDGGSGNGGILDAIKDAVSSVFGSIKLPSTFDIVDSLTDILGRKLNDIMTDFFGQILQGFLNLLADGIRQSVFLTPFLNMPWMWSLFWAAYAIGILLSIVGIVCAVVSMLLGKSKNKGGKNLIVLFLAAMAISYLSPWISNFIVINANEISDSIAKDTLAQAYDEFPQKTGMLRGLTKDQIKGFSSFDGNDLCKIAFAGRFIEGNFYETFKVSNGGGGLLLLILGMSVMILVGLMGVLRFLALNLLIALLPVYCAVSVFKRDYDVIAGWLNLFVKTVAIAWLFDLAFIFSAYVNRNAGSFVGAGQILACIFFIAALAIGLLFWVRDIKKAVQNPFTLNGGEVRASLNDNIAKAGQAIAGFGRMIPGGVGEGLAAFGGRMKHAWDERAKIAKEKAEGKYDPTLISRRDRIEEAKQKFMEEFYAQKERKMNRASPVTDIREERDKVNALGISVPGFSAGRLGRTIGDAMPYDADVSDLNSGVYISAGKLDAAADAVRKEFDKNIRKVYYNGEEYYAADGFNEEEITEMKRFMQENGLIHGDIITASFSEADLKTSPDDIAETLRMLETAWENGIKGIERDGGQYYEISLGGAQKDRVIRMLDATGTAYSEERGRIYVRSNAFDSAVSQYNAASDLLMKTRKDSEHGKYSIDMFNQDEYRSVKDMLDVAGINHEIRKNIMFDAGVKDAYREAIPGMMAQAAQKTKGEKERFTIVMQSETEARELKEILKTVLPQTAVDFNMSIGRAIVVAGEERQTAEDILRQYRQLPVYWHDGRYYYYRVGKTVKQNIVPPPPARAEHSGGGWELSGYRQAKKAG